MSIEKIQVYKLENTINGRFIGDFDSSLLKTPVVEVSVKYYKAGDIEKDHYQRTSREFIVIVEGEAEITGQRYTKGNIIVIPAGTITNFTAIKDCSITAIKIPGIKGDTYCRT